MAVDLHPARPVSAVSSDAAIEAARVVRVHLDGETYGIPAHELIAPLMRIVDAFMGGGAGVTGKAAMLRSGLKALIPLAIPLLTADVRQWSDELVKRTGCAPLPLPDMKTRHDDNLVYLAQYLAGVIVAVLAAQEWTAHCESVASDGGYVRLSGLSGSAPVVDHESHDAAGAAHTVESDN